MVHRPSDSRLLVNLLSHEKDYAKQLETLLATSHASLASFSAYASSSAPPTSQIIIQVAGTLVAADDALRKYSESLQQWQDQLKTLKRLEDDVANIMRDREILVTRLIKASKQKPLQASSSSSTLSTPKARSEVPLPAKLAAAQSELQACEAHLAAKERELAAMRTAAVRRGLSVRCAALAECGQTWTEMGTEALRSLGTLEEDIPMENGYSNGDARPQSQEYKYQRPTLENGNGPPLSDLSSSLGPSQSASQNIHAQVDHPPITTRKSQSYLAPSMSIPPAHAISDNTSSFAYPSFSSYRRDQSSDSGGVGGSSSDEEDRQYEVRENTRFKSNGASPPVMSATSRHVHFPFTSSAPSSPNPDTKSKGRQRRGSFLGSIAAFFHSSPSHKNTDLSSPPSPSFERTGGWQTRTDRNIMHAGRDDSDDERYLYRNRIVMPPSVIDSAPDVSSSPRTGTIGAGAGSQHRLKKRATGNTKAKGDRGLASEGDGAGAEVVRSNSKATSTGAGSVKKRKAKEQTTKDRPPLPTQTKLQAVSVPPQSTLKTEAQPVVMGKEKGKDGKETSKVPKIPKEKEKAGLQQYESPSLSPQDVFTGKKPTGKMLPAALPTEVSISRNSSASRHSHAVSLTTSVAGIASQPNPTMHLAQAHRRATSMDSGARKVSGHGHHAHGETGVSLMSVVEGVTKTNVKTKQDGKKARAQLDDPNSRLFFAHAPPPVSQTADLSVGPQGNGMVHGVAAGEMAREASEHSVPLTPSIPPPPENIKHVPSPQLKPLRSALRNSSRSPSPNTNMNLPPVVPIRSKLRPSPPQPPLPALPPMDSITALVNGTGSQSPSEPPSQYQTARNSFSETSSVSSYETTQETLQDDGAVEQISASPLSISPLPPAALSPPSPPPSTPSPPQASPLPPPPPPKMNGLTADANGSETSQSTSTASNGTQTARRKSVRMSLPPTFSSTPPAFDDDTDGEGHRHAPWTSPRAQPHLEYYPDPVGTSGWSSRIKEPTERDMWQDSSDEEDEEYSKAKRLLSQSPKKKSSKR